RPMTRINFGRVIIAGIVAGVVLNVCDVAGGMLLADQQKELISRLHLDPALMTDVSKAVPWIVIDFLVGMLMAFTYASIRPRFGPGPRTAITGGLLLYSTVTVLMYGFMSMGIFTREAFVGNAVVHLVAWLLGSLTAGALYKE